MTRAALVMASVLAALSGVALADDPAEWLRDETAHQQHVVGRYRNATWGFEVALPGVGGWMSTAPNPDHGVQIILGTRRTLLISAEADALEFGSSRAALDFALNPDDDAAKPPGPRRVERRVVGLGGLPAEEAIVGERDGRHVIIAQWVGPPEGPLIDELWLVTDAAHEATDTAAFALVVASFRHFSRP